MRLAQLKQRLLPDPALARCLTALDWCDALFDDELMWTSIKEQVRLGLFRSVRGSAVISDENKAARFVLELVARVAGEAAASGEHHIYRGVLSMQGSSYRDIALVALSQLEDNGWLNYEEFDERREKLTDAIRVSG